ncbi:hypothetical protein G5B26_25520 [Enterocloster clostridioformis]|uniref:Immunoglobulin n=1 Tax=Enterocloster clostridioformis TaxID=1531 RepID=A0ABD6LQ41_9FIRM|nr:hypothetical protein [Enterocloster clostridioformis]NSJ46831.1 hypothetical protein [Enterocloster clostridioformis]
MKLTRYEQETIINFNAQDQMATLYTRDPAVMRKVDALVIEYPDTFKCIGETDIDKTYEMPKSAVTYRKPRRLSEEQREAARNRLKQVNEQK